jgi:ABC-2 type transport system ATP-binding protein
MIEAHDLSKRYGSTTAVSDLSFSIRPGLVTRFLGPKPAGGRTGRPLPRGRRRPVRAHPFRASLEEAFMELTRESVEYQAAVVTR